MEKKSMVTLETPKEFFTEKLSKNLLSFPKAVQDYVIDLLCSFISTDLPDEPLALLLDKAQYALPGEKIKLYKKIGDIALYTTGYLEGFFHRRIYDASYFRALGQHAYLWIDEQIPSLRPLYSDLSVNFEKLSEVIALIDPTEKNSINILATYDQWLKTPHKRLKDRLNRAGIEPVMITMKPQ